MLLKEFAGSEEICPRLGLAVNLFDNSTGLDKLPSQYPEGALRNRVSCIHRR